MEEMNNMGSMNPNPQPTYNPQPVAAPAHHGNKKMTVLVIVVVILLAAVLIANKVSERKGMELDMQISQTQAEIEASDSIAQSIKAQGESDDLSSIEADLNATNVNQIDQ